MCVDYYFVVMEVIVKICGINISVSVNFVMVVWIVYCMVVFWLICVFIILFVWILEKIMNVSVYEIINYIYEVKFLYE